MRDDEGQVAISSGNNDEGIGLNSGSQTWGFVGGLVKLQISRPCLLFEFLFQLVWGGAQEFAFLTSSQGMLMPLVQGLQFGNLEIWDMLTVELTGMGHSVDMGSRGKLSGLGDWVDGDTIQCYWDQV